MKFAVKNPIYCLCLNDFNGRNRIIQKIVKSKQTMKKYIKNNESLVYTALSRDVYKGVEDFLKPGMDLNSVIIRNELDKLKEC